MKSFKLAQNATTEMLSSAICYGAVEVSSGVYLAIGSFLPKLLTHLPPESDSNVGGVKVRSLDFYLYSPEHGLDALDIESLDGLNRLLEVADSLCFDASAMSHDELVEFRDQLSVLNDYDITTHHGHTGDGSMFEDGDIFAVTKSKAIVH